MMVVNIDLCVVVNEGPSWGPRVIITVCQVPAYMNSYFSFEISKDIHQHLWPLASSTLASSIRQWLKQKMFHSTNEILMDYCPTVAVNLLEPGAKLKPFPSFLLSWLTTLFPAEVSYCDQEDSRIPRTLPGHTCHTLNCPSGPNNVILIGLNILPSNSGIISGSVGFFFFFGRVSILLIPDQGGQMPDKDNFSFSQIDLQDYLKCFKSDFVLIILPKLGKQS